MEVRFHTYSFGKPSHRSEIGGEDFTVTGLQSCDEKIHSLFGSLVDFF